MTVKHPAKFSEVILDRIGELLDEHGCPKRIIDPFAGTGRVHRLAEGRDTEIVGVEIEQDWAELHPNTVVGDALDLQFPDDHFDGLVTSPCYGSRMADHFNAQDGSRRHSYTFDIGHDLHPNNSGTLQWGIAYRVFHDAAWTECLRVLGPEALVIVNVSNHIRLGVEQPVTEWHLQWFLAHGCLIADLDRVVTPRLRDGANREARSLFESILVLRTPK